MTCIAAIAMNGVVYMGGDSAGVAGLSVTVRKDPKVFKVDDFLIGFTTSFRMGQLLQYNFTPPKLSNKEDLYKYMVTKFVDALRETFKKGGFSSITNGTESGGSFLVGVRGRLFSIDSDYQVGEAEVGYDAVGCGEEIAKGALYALRGVAIDPVETLRIALNAAQFFNGGVRGPFIVRSTRE